MNAFIINTFNMLCKNTSILFFAFLLLFFVHSPLNAATMTFDNGFESGNLSGWKTHLIGGKATVATSPLKTGKYSGNFDLQFVSVSADNYRAEIQIGSSKNYFVFGKEYWFSFDYRFEDWAKDSSAEIAPFQVHARPGSWDSACYMGTAHKVAPFLMMTQNDEAKFYTYGGILKWSAPIQKKQWQTIAVHFKPAKDSTGLIEAWKDGVKIVSVSGANQPKVDGCGLPVKDPYFNMGIYKWDWRTGRPATESSRRTFYVDNFKLAEGSSGLSMVSSTSTTQSTSSTSTTSTTSSTSTTNSAEDLVASWPMNTGTSTTTPDVSGNGYTGALVNGAQLISSGTVKLDGVNDYVNVGKPAVSGSAMTISAWLWADDLANCSSSDCRIISKAIGLAEQDHDFMISTVKVNSATRLRFRLNTSGATSTLTAGSGNILNKEWVHVAAVYDGKSMRLYQDGVLVGSRAKTGNVTLRNTGSTWIGGNPPSATARPWKGQIDDVAIYNYALTGAEIAELAK